MRTGYTFDGWTLNGQPYVFGTPVESDITLIGTFTRAYDPNNPQLSDLKNVLATDDPASIYPIGTEIPDTISGKSNPLIVTQYLSNNSLYGGASGVLLTRKYLDDAAVPFGSSRYYGSSSILAYLNDIYYEACSEELKSLLSTIEVRYSSDGNYKASGKWHIPSATEIGLDYSGMGEFLMLWQQRLGSSTPSNSSKGGRILRDSAGVSHAWWTRTTDFYSSTTRPGVYVGTSGELIYTALTDNRRFIAMCFVAKD